MIRALTIRLTLAITCLWAQSGQAASDIDKQRQDYATARQALKAGDVAAFQQRMARLQTYPLRPYLEYEFLKERLNSTPADTLRKFIAANQEAPVSEALHRAWLQHLVRRGEWKAFLKEYGAIDDTELSCYRLQRLLKGGETPGLSEAIGELWLTGHPLPAACEPVFAAWKSAGHMTEERVWARIRLAMERRNLTLARSLAAHLPPVDSVWVERWVAVHKDPLNALRQIAYRVESPIAHHIVMHGIARLAQRDPEVAMEEWGKLKARFPSLVDNEHYVLRSVGIVAAQNHLPLALQWLSALPADVNDDAVQQWRLRAAIRSGAWQSAADFLSFLPDLKQNDGQWRYWKARVMEQVGQKKEARALYAQLSRERSYYGFMAADRLGLAYAFQHASVPVKDEEKAAMAQRPGMVMARELFMLGEIGDARRQWNWMMRKLNNRELQIAAVLANEWGWHDRAILAVNKSDHLDDLELRFPLLYRAMVEASARAHSIDPSWMYGVIRQESVFIPDARSPAGALGLMQVMPATGRFTSRLLKLNVRDNRALLKPENNLRVGAGYLKIVLDQHRGHQTLATAAYNAGPNRVKRWMPEASTMAADVWVETIPYSETRNYVKNVMGFTTVYAHRLGSSGTRLHERMPEVVPLVN